MLSYIKKSKEKRVRKKKSWVVYISIILIYNKWYMYNIFI